MSADSTQVLLSLTKDSPLSSLLYNLLKYTSPGAQQYSINLLYHYPLSQVSFYIPQLLNIATQRDSYNSFDTYFFDSSLKDYNLAMKLYWYLLSYFQDSPQQSTQNILIHLERVIVMGTKHLNDTETAAFHLFSIEDLGEDSDFHFRKRVRADYHVEQTKLASTLINISNALLQETEDPGTYLKACLSTVNTWIKDLRLWYSQENCSLYTKRLFRGLVLPLDFSRNNEQIVVVNSEESKCFRTRTRVPYLVIFETIDINEEMTIREDNFFDMEKKVSLQMPEHLTEHETNTDFADISSERSSEIGYEFLNTCLNSEFSDTPWGEPWADLCSRIRSQSPFGHYQSWHARGVIVKNNDDLRQELLAMQIIKKCSEIFAEEKLSLFLRPYNILITGNNSGMIEYISDAVSIHYLKKVNPECKTLDEIYNKIWKFNNEEIRLNFVESMAGYSLISYVLNLKDRHNGNILIDSVGHVIHIDFGFFLTSSPGGNFNFESAPFKLTKEMIDIMGGYSDHMFNYYQVQIYKGFLALRRKLSELVLILEMMMPGTHLPCFQDSERALKDFKRRFFISLTDDQCLNTVRDLVNTAAENWKTTQYDYFQKRSNSIL